MTSPKKTLRERAEEIASSRGWYRRDGTFPPKTLSEIIASELLAVRKETIEEFIRMVMMQEQGLTPRQIVERIRRSLAEEE